MNQNIEKIIALGFVVVLISAAWATTAFRDGPSEPIDDQTRREAPDFTRPLLSGPDFVLSEHRGKTVIVDFWATWCGPCEVQMPVLDAIWRHRDQGADDLMIIGVSVDTDPRAKIAAWVAERGLEYPIVFADHDLATRYGVIGYPTLFVIDPDGGIHTQHVGVLSRPELEQILDEIRKEDRPLG